MKILALDLGRATGYATFNTEDQRVFAGVFRNPVSHAESPGAYWQNFLKWLWEKDANIHPNIIAYEEAYQMSRAAGGVFAAHVAIVQELAYSQNKIPCVRINSMTLKKLTTGSGRAPKDAMVAAMQKRWTWSGVDDNEADALAVLAWAIETFATPHSAETEDKPGG